MKINKSVKIIIFLVVTFSVIRLYFFTTEPTQSQAQVPVQQSRTLPPAQQKIPHIVNEKEATTRLVKSKQSFEERHKGKSSLFLLFDISLELHEDWSYTSKMHKKIKILKEKAKYLGEISIPYERGREKITDIKAHTITPDGEKHRYSKIQEFRTYKGYRMYSDARVKLITMPQVNVGSILEYEATITTKESPIKNAFWDSFSFDYAVPIKELNYTITFPKQFNMQYVEFNLEHKPTITETDSTTTYSWHLEDIFTPSERESYMPPPSLDYIKNVIEFSSIKNWSDVSDWYYSLVQKNLKINRSIEKTTEKVIEDHIGIKNKTRAILEYIQENFRYVSMSFGDNALEPHPTNYVFRNKYGDCKDLSLLCMAMLKVAGIKSYVALFKDEFSISDPQYDPPFPTLFDHVLLLVEDFEGGNFYIDPLLDGYDIGQYPMLYQRAYTFIITEDGGRFDRFPIFDEKRDYSHRKETITIKPNGLGIVEVEALWDLDFSINMRQKFNALDDEQRKKLFQALDTVYGEVLERKWENFEQRYGRINSYLKYKKEDMYAITDDMIIINLSNGDRTTDFTEEERKYPIFYPGNSLDERITVYRIPEGFRVSHMPKDLDEDIGFFNLERQYKHKDNEIVFTEIVWFRRKEIPAEECSKVKDFFDSYHKRTNQRLVLKRIKPWWQEVKDIFTRFKK